MSIILEKKWFGFFTVYKRMLINSSVPFSFQQAEKKITGKCHYSERIDVFLENELLKW